MMTLPEHRLTEIPREVEGVANRQALQKMLPNLPMQDTFGEKLKL